MSGTVSPSAMVLTLHACGSLWRTGGGWPPRGWCRGVAAGLGAAVAFAFYIVQSKRTGARFDNLGNVFAPIARP